MWNFGEDFEVITIHPSGNPIIKNKPLDYFIKSVHPDDVCDLKNELYLFASSKKGKFEYKFRSDYMSVNYRWYEMTGEVIYDEFQGKLRAIGIIQDVNDRVGEHILIKENKKSLLSAKEAIKTAIIDRNIVLDNLYTALIYVDNDYVVKWSSMQTIKDLFCEKAYAEGIPCYKSTFGREAPCKGCPVRKMFKSNQTQTVRITRKEEVLEITVNPVYQKRKLVGGVLRLDKITERVKQEQTIKSLNTLMDTILNNLDVFLYVKNPNDHFKYLYWNKAIADSFNLPASKVLGHTDEEIFKSKEEIERFRRNDEYVLENNNSVSFIEEYTSPNGEQKIVNSLKTVIPAGKGEKPWILGLTWDITDIKKAENQLIKLKEKAEESNRLKSSFLANMSHEIRTPLNAIVGFSELLCEIENEEDKKEFISIIRKNNDLLLQLISDILDLSKIEAESLEFIHSLVDINKLIRDVINTNTIKTDKPVPVILERYIPDCTIYTDEKRINQVLFNLINNAQKFTTTGDIKVGYYKVNEDYIKFYVKDTGTGIKPDKLDKIFERFIKLDSFKQGTGLGLSICQSIIEKLGGTIGVESQWGKGSCFWFILPCDKRKTSSLPMQN